MVLLINNDGNYSITLTEDELISIQVALAEQFMFLLKFRLMMMFRLKRMEKLLNCVKCSVIC